MTLNKDDTTRRRLLKGIGATGLALSTAGVAAATDGDPTESDGEVSPDGYWEYDCTQIQCEEGSGCQEIRRYCNAGGCSGWEPAGCCRCY